MASVDLTDHCQPTAARMVLHMLVRAANHDGTTHVNHQMADLSQLYKSGLHGPPAASEGPQTACNA